MARSDDDPPPTRWVRLDRGKPPDVAMGPPPEPVLRKPPPSSPPLPSDPQRPFASFEASPATTYLRAQGREERTRAAAWALGSIAVLALVASGVLAWLVAE